MSTNWNLSTGGVLIPKATEYRSHSQGKKSYLELSDLADEIKNMYDKQEVAIHPSSGLARVLNSADESIRKILSNDRNSDINLLWDSLHLERLVKSLRPLEDKPQLREYLFAIKNGDLDFLRRVRSSAKNRLFELEVWRTFFQRSDAFLGEPDVILKVEGTNIGFACKKVYSAKGVPKVLSNAVKQIRNSYVSYGMVAFNIDDLLPEGSVIKGENRSQAAEFLSQKCVNFLIEVQRNLLRYFDRNEIIGVLVSCSAIVDLPSKKPRFSNMQEWFFWTVPELKKEQLEAALLVKNVLGCS